MPLVGNPAEFAVEYHLKDVCPPYGNLHFGSRVRHSVISARPCTCTTASER